MDNHNIHKYVETLTNLIQNLIYKNHDMNKFLDNLKEEGYIVEFKFLISIIGNENDLDNLDNDNNQNIINEQDKNINLYDSIFLKTLNIKWDI